MRTLDDRAELLHLLAQLGEEDEERALAAARELDRRVVVEGAGWDALLVRDMGSENETTIVEDPVEPEANDIPVPRPGGEPVSSAASADDRAILERLLHRSDISEQTREELEGLQADMADGSFSAMDAKYLRALDARLARP